MNVPVDMKEIESFLKNCSDMELVSLQSEARNVKDKDMLTCVLKELGERQKKHDSKT